MACLCRFLRSIRDFFVASEEPIEVRILSLEEMLEYARREWMAAVAVFQENQDPDMVDYTVFNLKASEERYNYLLKKAREEHQIIDKDRYFSREADT